MILSSPECSGNRFQKVVDGLVGLEGVPKFGATIDGVGVPPADLADPDDSGCFEFGDDSVHTTFGDPHPIRDLTDERVRVFGEAHEDMSVIAQEGPAIGGLAHDVNVVDDWSCKLNR